MLLDVLVDRDGRGATNAGGVGSVAGKEEERQMFQQMQAMAQKQVHMPYGSVVFRVDPLQYNGPTRYHSGQVGSTWVRK